MKKFKVLYIVNVPAPYMVNYFNELGKLVELTVIFEKDTSTERDKSWSEYRLDDFNSLILKGISTAPDAAFCPSVIRALKNAKEFDFIFISSMATPTGIMAILNLRRRGIPYILESEGGFAKSGKGLKEGIKRFIMKGADKYFSTSPIGDNYFMTYGAPADSFVKYPFTSIYEKDIASDVATLEERASLREKLGMSEKKIVLAVGQFIHRKGFDVLMEAAKSLPEDIGVYFVGGEPTEEYLKFKEDFGLKQLHFVGFLSKEELSEFYRASDVFVLPTREDCWGLVINEAMACGLPVISTDMCIAGVELVTEDVNGYIVPIEDSVALATAIEKTLASEEKRAAMGRASLERIHWYTFESMARVHLEYYLSS